MRVLGIDPSSRCVGYALLCGLRREDLRDGGRLIPSTDRGFVSHLPAWLFDHLMLPELAAYRRIHSMLCDLASLMDETGPDLVIVEIPSGKAGTGSRHGARGALTTYGFAAGVILQACNDAVGIDRVLPVTERQWTDGLGNKGKRQTAIAAYYGSRYERETDPGGDLSDAIGVARWGILERHGNRTDLLGSPENHQALKGATVCTIETDVKRRMATRSFFCR